MARIGQVPKSQLYAGPGYNHFEVPPQHRREFEEKTSLSDEAAMTDAAEALRAAEIEAVDPDDKNPDDMSPDDTNLDGTDLYDMNIDELRIVAGLLQVPNREQITDRDELISAIERSL